MVSEIVLSSNQTKLDVDDEGVVKPKVTDKRKWYQRVDSKLRDMGDKHKANAPQRAEAKQKRAENREARMKLQHERLQQQTTVARDKASLYQARGQMNKAKQQSMPPMGGGMGGGSPFGGMGSGMSGSQPPPSMGNIFGITPPKQVKSTKRKAKSKGKSHKRRGKSKKGKTITFHME